MKNIFWFAIAVVIAGLAAVPASAHPGHDLLDYGPAHAVLSPYHLAISAAMGLALVGAARFVRRTALRKSVRRLGAAVLLGTVLFWGLAF